MRNVLPRIPLVLVALLAMSPTSARAETSAYCDPATATPIIEYTTIDGSYPNGAIMTTQGDRRVICFSAAFANVGSGAIVIDPASGGTLPSVTFGTNLNDCGTAPIISNSTLHLAVDVSSGTVCLRIGSTPKTLKFSAGSGFAPPTIQVWRDGTWSTLDVIGCPVEYALYQFGTGGDQCMTNPGRLL